MRHLSLLLLPFLLAPLPATAASDCVKSVFNAFCLGGSGDTLPNAATAPGSGAQTGELTLEHAGRRVHVELRKQRIRAVWREEPPGTWINFLQWKGKLDRLYGRGEDLSDFPAYAGSRSARFNAVLAGKGHAHTRWSQPGWHVSVIWDNPEFVVLRYALDDAQETPDFGGSDGL